MENSNTNASTEDARQPLHLFPAGLSLICPGLGQLIQGRPISLLLLFVWALTLAGWLPYVFAAIGMATENLVGFILLFLLFFGWIFLLLPVLFVLFSVLDAATWERGKPLRFKKRFIVLIILLVPLSILLDPYAAVMSVFSDTYDPYDSTRHMECDERMRDLLLALRNYHESHGTLPPAYTVDENGKPLHSWRVLLLPYVGEQELYEKIRLDELWDSEYNRQFHEVQVGEYRAYQCPTRRSTFFSNICSVCRKNHKLFRTANCDYSVVIGDETAFPGSKAVAFADITDGPANTILVVERLVPVCWMDPNNEIRFDVACEGINKNFLGIGSAHRGGAHAVTADIMQFFPETKNIRPFLTKSAGDKIEWW